MARDQSLAIHEMTMSLPKFELYEMGQQIRRSSKSTRATIVEGYGRRIYKADYIRFLIYALASNDETIDHLETLFETGSLNDEVAYTNLHINAEILGKKLNTYLKWVQLNFKCIDPEPSFQYHRSSPNGIVLTSEFYRNHRFLTGPVDKDHPEIFLDDEITHPIRI